MPVEEIGRFLPPLATGFDVAIGSREGRLARRVGEPAYRHLAGRLFNFMVQHLALPGIEDSQCGFKMFTAGAVAAIFPRVTVDGWAFDVEVLTIARQQRLGVIEVPIEWHYRADSRLSILRNSAGMLGELLRIKWRALRGAYRASDHTSVSSVAIGNLKCHSRSRTLLRTAVIRRHRVRLKPDTTYFKAIGCQPSAALGSKLLRADSCELTASGSTNVRSVRL